MSNPDGATKPKLSATCAALLLTSDMSEKKIRGFRSVCETLGVADVESEILTGNLLMWRDLDAVLVSVPMLNFAAMHLQLRLRGPIGVRPVYGDVLLTGRGIDGNPKPLSVSEIRDIRSAMSD